MSKDLTKESFDELNELSIKYNPKNIPEEIRNSKDVIIYSHTKFDKVDNKDGFFIYIWNITPSNTRKNTIIRLNKLLRKYDYPMSASCNSDGNGNYIGVTVNWKQFYRYVNADGDILKCIMHKRNKHLELYSRLLGPSEISISVTHGFHIKTFFYIPDEIYEVGLKHEDLTVSPGSHTPIYSNNDSDPSRYMFYFNESNVKTELLLRVNYWSSKLYEYNEIFNQHKHRVSRLVGMPYDIFTLEYKLDKLDI